LDGSSLTVGGAAAITAAAITAAAIMSAFNGSTFNVQRPTFNPHEIRIILSIRHLPELAFLQ
jgi:ABC-type antimicrobial peptide transport system permease subunit